MPSRSRSLRLITGALCLLAPVVLSPACGARTGLDAGLDAPEVAPECGDHVVAGDEACDLGPGIVGDDCLDTCAFAFCGDGELRAGELCDDGNDANGDGCSSNCTIPTCGDGIVDPGEECDSSDPGLCTPTCTLPVCGDGFLAPNEECDAGAQNGRLAALVVVSEGITSEAIPVTITQGVASYYSLSSASAHMGIEQEFASFLHPVLDPSGLSLVTVHNIDEDSSQIATGTGEVHQRFTGLPEGAIVLLADDRPEEFSISSDGAAIGNWNFNNNTDGGVIGPLPFPGEWAIRVDSDFTEGITTFELNHADLPVAFNLDAVVFLVAHAAPSPCTDECTLPKCGDGFVDGGEICDDGDASSSGPCNASCSGFN